VGLILLGFTTTYGLILVGFTTTYGLILVGFTTTYAINTYHYLPVSYQFDSLV
jgi:hypothetical protein